MTPHAFVASRNLEQLKRARAIKTRGPGTVSVLELKARKLISVIPVSQKTQRISISVDDRTVFTSDQTKPGKSDLFHGPHSDSRLSLANRKKECIVVQARRLHGRRRYRDAVTSPRCIA